MEVTLRAFVISTIDGGTFQPSESDCFILCTHRMGGSEVSGGKFGRDGEKPLSQPGNEPYWSCQQPVTLMSRLSQLSNIKLRKSGCGHMGRDHNVNTHCREKLQI
jgi:hypothetical protein